MDIAHFAFLPHMFDFPHRSVAKKFEAVIASVFLGYSPANTAPSLDSLDHDTA